MKKLTIAILTFNEIVNIEEVIASSLKCTDDVLVVDSGSSDGTVELAKKLGARVVYRAWDNDFAAQRNFALECTDADWIFYVDADERLTDVLIAKVQEILASNLVNRQYLFMRKSVAFGKKFNHGVLNPDFVFRMFPVNKVKWVSKVHEKSICELKKEVIPSYIEHYTYRSWEQWEKKMSQYSTIWAEDAYENGKRSSLVKAIAHGIGGFVKMFFLKKGFLDGMLGIILCFNHFHYTLMKYLKLYEVARKANEEQK